jgi:hypothetical protein
VNILKKQSQTDNKLWPSSLGVGRGVNNPLTIKKTCYEQFTQASDPVSLDKRPKLWNTDMRFGTWNVRSLYRAGSLNSVSRELARYKLDLVRVQEVRWEGGGTEPAGEYTFFYGKGNENHELGTGFCCA